MLDEDDSWPGWDFRGALRKPKDGSLGWGEPGKNERKRGPWDSDEH